MSNKFKDIRIKSTHTTFDDVVNIKNFIQMILKWKKSHTKISSFTTLLLYSIKLCIGITISIS